MAPSQHLRFLYVVWGVLECLLFGGLLFGWGSVVFVLKEECIFSHLCPNKTQANRTLAEAELDIYMDITSTMQTGYRHHDAASNYSFVKEKQMAGSCSCLESDSVLFLAFTIGTMMFCAGCAAMGLISIKFGTRVTRLCALASFLSGSLLTGFTSKDFPWLIFPGLSFLGIGGIPLMMTNAQFSVLFTHGSSTVMALFSGAFDASSGIMLIVKLIYERGVAFKWSMLFISSLHLLTLVNTFCFLPRDFIRKPTPRNVGSGTKEEGACLTSDENKEDKEEKEGLPSVISCILSPVYLFHVVWLSVLQLRFYYFIASFNSWLTALVASSEVSHYTNALMYTMICGCFMAPLSGLVYDFNKRFFCESKSKLRRDLMPSVLPLALTGLFGIMVSILVLIQDTRVLYLTFIFVTIFRSFLYSMAAAYIGVMFPSEYFGIMYGVMIILAGIFGLAQYGLFSWAEAAGFSVVNQFLVAFVALGLVHPLYQWFACYRAESQAQ
ncbi:solute carrier family 43 member 3-like isoform X2 [Pomacea canaliculata]|uniref:solute carrier family 43 member 3-like isoform X2 n=1 Tax=Pomacea canaliculata TaxID=400727 RepID=UPI000D72A4BE|nr:solute carrier family 43 member 3-like isoform X2 [Pomacea canaliculata]